jgi:hypothetical protein
MSAARIVALTDIRVRAIDQAPTEKTSMRARHSGAAPLRSITEINTVENRSAKPAPRWSADITTVRNGIASQSTAQK